MQQLTDAQASHARAISDMKATHEKAMTDAADKNRSEVLRLSVLN
jgi:hypothetical protein